MNSISRNVAELSSSERHVYESVLGQTLRDDQIVVIRLVGGEAAAASPAANGAEITLEPYGIWSDMSDSDIAELDAAILQRSDSRSM